MGSAICKFDSACQGKQDLQPTCQLDSGKRAASLLSTCESEQANALNDFKLVQRVRQGAGKAFLVQRVGSRQHNAMKVVRKSEIRSADLVTRVMGERNKLARAPSPFLANISHAFETAEKYYFITDHFKTELHALIQGGLSEAQIRFYASELVLALRHLHALGIYW